MRLLFKTSTSVTRWLPVVVGCAVLETAQPMIAAEPSAPAAERSGDTLLIPGGGPSAAPEAPRGSGGSGGSWIFAGIIGLGAAGFWFWQRRRMAPTGGRPAASLRIEQTRPLGNRQFLVVAECDGRRLLLGVSPGGINMLSTLDPKEDDTDATDVP